MANKLTLYLIPRTQKQYTEPVHNINKTIVEKKVLLTSSHFMNLLPFTSGSGTVMAFSCTT